jgi:ABC-type oligopeptide transport system substrate-binding subunit
LYPADTNDTASEFTALGAMFAAAGIAVMPLAVPLNDWNTDVSAPLARNNIRLIDNGWIQDYQDPQDYCENLLASYSPDDIGGYHDETYDDLMKTGNATFNTRKRAALYIRAQHLAIGAGAFIPIGNSEEHYLLNPAVHGLVGSASYGFPVARDDEWGNVSISPHTIQ